MRAFANSVRLATDSMDVFAFPIVEVFEALAAEGYYDFEILPVEEMQNSYGETSYRDDLIRIREDIYDGACLDDPFSRSTIAHELLHFLKHRQEEVTFCKSVEEINSIRTFENPEWQANCFAGELLVPKHLVQHMTVEEVMTVCKVSRQMAETQLSHYQEEGWDNEKSLLVGTKG
ncbi:TPA: ImmA/IrrE family metallo-endopeptidase [Streptococcus suis]